VNVVRAAGREVAGAGHVVQVVQVVQALAVYVGATRLVAALLVVGRDSVGAVNVLNAGGMVRAGGKYEVVVVVGSSTDTDEVNGVEKTVSPNVMVGSEKVVGKERGGNA
jgi:hypothetical protein